MLADGKHDYVDSLYLLCTIFEQLHVGMNFSRIQFDENNRL